jgi:hypothetical protein
MVVALTIVSKILSDKGNVITTKHVKTEAVRTEFLGSLLYALTKLNDELRGVASSLAST